MGEPAVNLDKFTHWPTHHVVGVLDSATGLPALVINLQEIGVAPEDIEVLRGEEGAEILDENVRHHGLHAHLLRGFQRLGYDQPTLAIYDEALRDGALLVHVPAMPRDRRRVADILFRHSMENVGYFGTGTFEQFTRNQT